MIVEILTTMNILEKLGKFRDWCRRKRSRPDEVAEPVESVTSRFVRLFEGHDVHRNQIPRFFGHGLTLKDVQDDASLLAKLDETMLDAACALFAVRREWLDGAEDQVYLCHDFYKLPEAVDGYLESLRAATPDGGLGGVLIATEEEDGQALLLLQEKIGAVGEKPIYRYHLCNNWSFVYWKSRAYLTACVAIAWKHSVYVRGVYRSKKDIERIEEGKTLLDLRDEGEWSFGGKKWYPEDLALRPEVFLKGIDPEQNNFGIKASLRMWLDLEEAGYMDTGLGMYEKCTVRQLFQQELAKHLPASADAMA